MEQRGTPGTLLAVRLLLGAAVVGLMAVGVVEMQASLIGALVSVGAFGFVVANIVLWQNGERSSALWRRSAAVALKAVTLLLVFVGSISVLDGGTSLVGVGMLFVWWRLRRRGTWVVGAQTTQSQDSARHADADHALGSAQTRPGELPVRQTDREEGLPAPVPPGRQLDLWLRPGFPMVGDVENLVRALDAPSLARAWAASRAKGITEGSVQDQMDLARLRQVLLDECERRDPVAFASWLERGAPDGPPPSSSDGL